VLARQGFRLHSARTWSLPSSRPALLLLQVASPRLSLALHCSVDGSALRQAIPGGLPGGAGDSKDLPVPHHYVSLRQPLWLQSSPGPAHHLACQCLGAQNVSACPGRNRGSVVNASALARSDVDASPSRNHQNPPATQTSAVFGHPTASGASPSQGGASAVLCRIPLPKRSPAVQPIA